MLGYGIVQQSFALFHNLLFQEQIVLDIVLQLAQVVPKNPPILYVLVRKN